MVIFKMQRKNLVISLPKTIYTLLKKEFHDDVPFGDRFTTMWPEWFSDILN